MGSLEMVSDSGATLSLSNIEAGKIMRTNADGKQVELLIQDMPEGIRNRILQYEAEKLKLADVPVSHMIER